MLAASLEARQPHRVSQIGADAEVCAPETCSGDLVAGRPLPIDIADAFVAAILKPYRANAQYLKSAQITHFSDKTATKDAAFVAGTGRFAIPESCYIDDTGHFNAVEFVAGCGLGLVSDLGPEEVEMSYLRTKHGRPLGRTFGHIRMAHARAIGP